MLNFEKFHKATQLTEAEMKDFMNLALFDDMDKHMREVYKVKPKYAYSSCAMDNNIWRGWNIKYQKSGKSLCTLYPQQGYFMALVPGKSFKIRNEQALVELKQAIEMRVDEIAAKKKGVVI